ncbi:hypothetical protein MUP95_02145 [bacterium]|nr:hypothetical protein [bacterium]
MTKPEQEDSQKTLVEIKRQINEYTFQIKLLNEELEKLRERVAKLEEKRQSSDRKF